VTDVTDGLRQVSKLPPGYIAVDSALRPSNMRAPGTTPGLSESDMHASVNLETNMNNAR